MFKERIIYLDVLRVLACLMIIAMHAPIPETGLGSMVLSTDSLITAPGVGLFIMVSGALLLPIKMPTRAFLKKRLIKIISPTLFWTIIYMTALLQRGDLTFNDLPHKLISIPFSVQFNGVLWFVYMLIGLYLLAPIISPWLEKSSKQELEIYLVLWAITLCYPLIRNYIVVNEGKTGILYYFGGYVGYFLLGYYLHKYFIRIPFIVCITLIIIPVIIGAYCKLMGISVDFYDMFWYLSILTVIAAAGWFGLIQKIKSFYYHKWIVLVSNCCFGIYLSHILVMRFILWHWEVLRQMGGVTQIAVTTALTFAISFVLTWAISYIPFSEYIIGFTSRRRKLTNTNFTNEHK